MAGPCLQTSMQLQFLDTDFNWTSFLRALLAELVGTAVFIFFSTATVTSGCHTSGVASNSGNRGDTSLTTALLNIALAFGFILFVVVYFTASFSGGHINPADTIAFVGACYIVLQLSGALTASGILKGLDPTGSKAAAGAANQLNPK